MNLENLLKLHKEILVKLSVKLRKQINKLRCIQKILTVKEVFVHKINLKFLHLKMKFVLLNHNLLMNKLIHLKYKVKRERLKLIWLLLKEKSKLLNNNWMKQKKIWNVNVNVLQKES